MPVLLEIVAINAIGVIRLHRFRRLAFCELCGSSSPALPSYIQTKPNTHKVTIIYTAINIAILAYNTCAGKEIGGVDLARTPLLGITK